MPRGNITVETLVATIIVYNKLNMSHVNNVDQCILRAVNNMISQKQLTIIIFFRGWWCPACRIHLSQVEKIKLQLHNKNVGVIGVTSQSEKNGSISALALLFCHPRERGELRRYYRRGRAQAGGF